MQILTPLAGLVALLVAVPLVAFFVAQRRNDQVGDALGIAGNTLRGRIAALAALITLAAFLAAALMQPTIVRHLSQRVRTDAEAWFVLDTSLSMKAASSPHGRSRLQRAKALAERLRHELGDVPVGLASITDRSMAHLYPTADEDTFQVAIRKAIGIERPPPTDGFSVRVTTLGSLARIASDNFFASSAKHRLLVAFTDGETKPFRDRSLITLFNQPPGVSTILVRLWRPTERVYINGIQDPGYRPDARGAQYMRELAASTGGVAFDEGQFKPIVDAARRDLGDGPTRVLSREERQLELAPYAALGALLPLGFLLYRRNL
jgi:von Willebrand factor type A domain